ncbi:MAG TPA: M48 family metallopeptidase [Victivallales bacterium]|nr:M48 family metallopeptidase [Victivallales bacterium]HPO91279.1 M48 family metallopeptidase [Victivallales bacterium]HRR06863.1 M48 family metallopeptidase [Victivallales bacterium]HRR28708.1 M48 family metallopeptidase [Victivallales bacterium]HRU01882.1 M48 family metallopeptidase [Victivallales bacterium]
MWEIVRQNKIKSAFLICAMGLLLLFLGASFGVFFSRGRSGIVLGISFAGVIWFFLTFIAFVEGKNILLAFSGAKEVKHKDAPQLYNIVEEMKIAAALPSTPKVYIIESNAPNAFAVGSPGDCAVAVTTGLLTILNRDELQAVIAHEIGHIKNEDTKFLTLAGVMLGTIVILSDMFTRMIFYGNIGGRRSRSSRDSGGQIQVILIFAGIILAIIAPFIAQLIYFACSRSREYLADASSAIFTRYPEGLASALEKISAKAKIPLESANRVTAPMYIIPPLGLDGHSFSSLFSTHPPTEERIKILRSMAGARIHDYNEAYKKFKKESLISNPEREINEGQLRLRGVETKDESIRKRAKEANNILMKSANFKFFDCSCGLKFKVPPGFIAESVNCPRCGKHISLNG